MEKNLKKSLLETFETFKNALFNCDKAVLQNIFTDDYRGINLAGKFEDRNVIIEAYGSNDIKLEKYFTFRDKSS